MNREALDKGCERGILGLVLAILIFGPLAIGAVRAQEFLVLQGLTVAVMLLWGVRLWLGVRSDLLWPPVCWAVVAFVIYAIVRYFTADIEYVARLEVVRILVYAFLFLAIVNNLHRQESMHIITLTLVFLAMAIACFAVFQFITGSQKVWTFNIPYAHRASGTYISPNHFGGFLEMILPLGLGWLLVSRAKTLTRIFVGYASLVMLVGIAITVSRGAWVATALSLIFFFGALALHRTYRLPALALLAVILIAGIIFAPRDLFLQLRARRVVEGGKVDDDLRFALWKPAYRMWQDHPWWGAGPAHFDYRFGQYRTEAVQKRPDRVHNDYLNTLADWGIAGAALIASAWALLFAGVVKTWRFVRRDPGDLGGRQSNKFAIVLGATVGLIAILAHSFVDFNLHIPANAILCVTLMALLTGCLRFATERYWFTARAANRIALTAALALGVVVLGWQGARRAAETVWLARAEQAPRSSPARIAALEKAFAIEPDNFDTANLLGEAFRAQSWEGGDDYVEWAMKARAWFERGIWINPYDDRNFLGCGLCLDWVGKHEEAAPYFDRAVRLEPNSAFNVAYMGWHYVQVGDYAAARVWFERSRRLEWETNRIADAYLEITRRKLLEAAAGDPVARLRH